LNLLEDCWLFELNCELEEENCVDVLELFGEKFELLENCCIFFLSVEKEYL